MELSAESRRQIVLSIVAVGFFVALMLGIGLTFGGTSMPPVGGLALVGAITLFVLVMGGIGIYLARKE